MAGDGPTDQRGVLLHVHHKSTVPSIQARLLSNALEVAVRATLIGAQRVAGTRADGHAGAGVLLLVCVSAGVLQAFDQQAAAHLGLDRRGCNHTAFKRGVAAAVDAHGVAGVDARVGVGEVVPRLLAASRTGAGSDPHTAGAVADAEAARAGLVAARQRSGILRSKQFNIAVCRQAGVTSCAHLAAANDDAAVFARSAGADAHRAAAHHRAAARAVVGLEAVA